METMGAQNRRSAPLSVDGGVRDKAPLDALLETHTSG